MGVTIRYQGRLGPKAKTKDLYILARIHCEEHEWGMTPFEAGADGKSGFFAVHPHENCELLNFRIDAEGRFRDACKTQFAPLEVHVGVVGLLEAFKNRLAELLVEDEGDYWETRKRDRLQQRIEECYRAIEKAKAEDPAYYGPVRAEDGRIADLMK